jgi:hypothetical protein
LEAGDAHHGQLLAYVDWRTVNFRLQPYVFAVSAPGALGGIALAGVLVVIEGVGDAVPGQERHFFPPYYT